MTRTAVLVLVLPALLAAESERPQRLEEKRYELKIHVPDQSGIYFSAWAKGDVITDHDGSDKRVVTYKRRFIWYDSCTWESTETLTPTAPDKYDYAYREVILSCPKGGGPNGVITPRDGKVTVHKIPPDDRPLTPLFAWIHDWKPQDTQGP